MRRRQFIHVVDFAVRSAPPVERYPVPRGDPLFGVGGESRIRRRIRTAAFRNSRRNRPRRFCRVTGPLWLARRFRVITSFSGANLWRLGAICIGPPRGATPKTNAKGAQGARHLEMTEAPRQFQKRKSGAAFRLRSNDAIVSTAHDCGFGGGGFRRAAIRASSLLAASLNFSETSRKNAAPRRSVSGATSCSMYRRSRVNSSSMRFPNSSN